MPALQASWTARYIGKEAVSDRAAVALEALRRIGPRDELEAMLTVQMAANHDAALTCFRLATCPGETATSRERHLQSGQQVMALFPRQLEAFSWHRDKGKQPESRDPTAVVAAIDAQFEEILREALDTASTQIT